MNDPHHSPPAEDPALAEEARARPSAQGQAAEGAAQDPTPEATIARLTAERDEMRERWLRAEAETQNLRARMKRELDDTRQYAVQKFAADIVETAENLRRGIDSLPGPTPGEPPVLAKLREGLQGIERNFVGVLERHGIQRVDPTGHKFDANLHQAMAEQPSDQHPAGHVAQAYTQAWTLNGRLLKPAMVVVSNGAANVA